MPAEAGQGIMPGSLEKNDGALEEGDRAAAVSAERFGLCGQVCWRPFCWRSQPASVGEKGATLIMFAVGSVAALPDLSLLSLVEKIVGRLHKGREHAAVDIMSCSRDLNSAVRRGQILLRALPGSVI